VVSLGETQQIAATVSDQYGNAIANAPLSYSVGSAAIATVSSSGMLTGVALGSTVVNITTGALTKSVSVFVSGTPVNARIDVPEPGQPFGVGISKNGVVLVGEPTTNKVGRYDLPSFVLKGAIAVGVDPADIAFSPDGLTAYVTNVVTATLSIVNVATNAETAQVALPGPAYRVVATPDGSKVYVTTANGFLATMSVPTSSVSSVSIGGTLNGIALHPTQPLLYVSSTNGTVTEVSRTTGQPTRSFQVSGTAQEVVVSSDGALLYVANESGPLEVRSTSTLAVQSLVGAASGAFGAALSPDNTLLFVSQSSAGTVVVLDRATLFVIKTFTGGSPRRIAFNRTGTTVVIANEAGYVTFIK
jgi:YVTN family beta-propeller protein